MFVRGGIERKIRRGEGKTEGDRWERNREREKKIVREDRERKKRHREIERGGSERG